jgi:hypothetical protein
MTPVTESITKPAPKGVFILKEVATDEHPCGTLAVMVCPTAAEM